MKNSSFETEGHPGHATVQSYVYHDWAAPEGSDTAESEADAEADPSAQGERLAQERQLLENARQEGFNQARQQLWPEALAQAQAAMQAELERHAQAQQQQVRQALSEFQRQREQYFCQLERDVVQLVLSIARKVLCREAQIDPLLLAGAVHVALEPVAVGVPVTLVVPPSSLAQWQELFAHADRPLAAVQTDPALEPHGCRLETETGSTDLSLEAQLREIEQGFLDLLHRRTAIATHA